jgi:hypothetical protein
MAAHRDRRPPRGQAPRTHRPSPSRPRRPAVPAAGDHRPGQAPSSHRPARPHHPGPHRTQREGTDLPARHPDRLPSRTLPLPALQGRRRHLPGHPPRGRQGQPPHPPRHHHRHRPAHVQRLVPHQRLEPGADQGRPRHPRHPARDASRPRLLAAGRRR